MDPALHYGIYREGVDEQIIIRHNKPVKPYELYYLTIDYIWEN